MFRVNAIYESPTANSRESKMEMPEKITACFNRGVISLLRNTVETPNSMLPKSTPFNRSGTLMS